MAKSWRSDVDRLYPEFFAALAVAAYMNLFGGPPVPKTAKDLFSACINVSAISIGFLATAKSIIISTGGNRPIRMLKQAGRYRDLVQYLWRAVWWSFMLAIVSTIGLVADLDKPKALYPLAFAGWLGVAVATAFSCYRVTRVLTVVLSQEPDP
jgi:hypothetical protein